MAFGQIRTAGVEAMSIADKNIWERVSKRIAEWSTFSELFRYGQEDSLQWISRRIKENGIIIADEVGLGKTRLALLVMIAVLEEGGSVVAVVPPGLLYQWRQEAKDVMLDLLRYSNGQKIRDWKPVILRTYDDLFNNFTDELNYPLANPDEFRWVLISQTFDIYRIYSTALCRRIELPALVQAHRAIDTEMKNGKSFIKYRNSRQKNINNRRASLKDKKKDKDKDWENKNKAAEYLSKKCYLPFYDNLLDDNRILPIPDGNGRAGEKCTHFFQSCQKGHSRKPLSSGKKRETRQEGLGRKLLKHLMGVLIGPIDLLVIDEAHKNRDDEEKPQKRLGSLFGEILVLNDGQCRRICMTATPIELNSSQWFDLLKRAGISDQHPNWPNISKSINEFSSLLQQAHNQPDQLDVLDRLMASAKRFKEALAPFVTRRRRLFQKEMKELLPRYPKGAHPHRDIKTHPIEIISLHESWRKMVLALEGQGISSKGIDSLRLAQKLVGIRYVAGLNVKFEYEDIENKSLKDITRKEMRTRAWANLQKGLAQEISGHCDWLWRHPRIIYAADRIEELCEFNGLNPREKVLVFGRFSEPLRVLYKTLNLRHTLRIVDSENVALVPNVNEDDLLFSIYNDQFDQNKFHGILKNKRLTLIELIKHVKEARKAYENKRDALRKRLNKWFDSPPDKNSLKHIEMTDENYKRIIEVLRADVFDHILYNSKDPSEMYDEELHSLAKEAWTSHLKCILHDYFDEREEYKESQEENKGNKKITPEKFIEYLEREPRSHFCRLLDGSVHHPARRSIQASFNRQETGPYVLIAQSIVGREGLNLHQACRRVYMFHPEWNPAVTEQQIGRVDRIESLWTKMAESWTHNPDQSYPKIEVESLVFQGTYDEYQANILSNRRASMNAQLFGALLDEETIVNVPEVYREKLAEDAPNWEPNETKSTSINFTEKIKKLVGPDSHQEPTTPKTISNDSTPANTDRKLKRKQWQRMENGTWKRCTY